MIQRVKWMEVRNYEAVKEEKKPSFVQQNSSLVFTREQNVKRSSLRFEKQKTSHCPNVSITDIEIHITHLVF